MAAYVRRCDTIQRAVCSLGTRPRIPKSRLPPTRPAADIEARQDGMSKALELFNGGTIRRVAGRLGVSRWLVESAIRHIIRSGEGDASSNLFWLRT